MNRGAQLDAILEPERYEMRALPLHMFLVNRRDFMRSIGGGIAVAVLLSQSTAHAQESGGAMRGEQSPPQISAWLHIGPDGVVTVYTGKVEIGQNIRTSLTQTVADELRVPVESVSMVMGDTQLTPYDLGTFGSRSTPQMGSELRRASAAARQVLIGLAARQWNVDRTGLTAADGKVIDHGANRTLAYSELAQGQWHAELIPASEPVTPAVDWKIAGKSTHKIDGRDFVTGKHKYTPDLKLPGMLYGKVVRPAAFGATLEWVDVSAAKAMPGVTVVHDGDFLAVAAPDERTAGRAMAVIPTRWKTTQQPSSRNLFAYLKQNAEPARENGNRQALEQALAAAAHKLEATYTISYIAHCPLEPRAALAQWTRDGNVDKVTVWAATQRPFAVRQEVAQALHISEDKVRIVVPDTGSAYGGKHTGEHAVEAARIARAAGAPVHLLWTRVEEFTWAYFRPAGVIDVRGGVSSAGALTAWEFHNYNSGNAALNTVYNVPNPIEAFHNTRSPLRQGSYRSLAAAANHFARESFMDELAHAVGIDPLDFRLNNLRQPRLHDVFQAAAQQFGWQGRRKQPGRGFGLAGGIEKGGHIATFAEVAVDRAAGPTNGKVQIVRVVQAFDCGAIVNPDELKLSIAGAITQGIGGALYEAIEFDNGRILNPHFAAYRVPRFRDQPQVEVLLVDRKDQPSFGAGETPIVGLAPAVGNAIFDAIGVRLRSLPMLPGGTLPHSA